jgi:Glyoxalase/Bleomycin resistance protein/Dioxygenase superfamily
MTTPDVKPRIIWHAGFIVDNLEEAMSELSVGLGLTWAPIHDIRGQKLSGPDGKSWILGSRVCFSTDLPLSLELIEEDPGTPNVRRGESAFHHLGYWDDDLMAEEQRLAGLGYGCVMFRDDPEQALRRVLVTDGPYEILLEATSALVPRAGLEAFYPKGNS